MGQIIPTRHVRWRAPETWLTDLAQKTSQEVKINAGGEVAPDIPERIAVAVLGGEVWADYCGHPMYYMDNRLWFLPVRLGQSGFSGFLKKCGAFFPYDFWADQSGFVFPRSLRVLQETVPKFIAVNEKAPHTKNIFSCFGMKLGKGWYFYAYGDENGRGVPPADYAAFIEGILHQPPVPPVPPILQKNLPLIIAAGAGLGVMAILLRGEKK